MVTYTSHLTKICSAAPWFFRTSKVFYILHRFENVLRLKLLPMGTTTGVVTREQGVTSRCSTAQGTGRCFYEKTGIISLVNLIV